MSFSNLEVQLSNSPDSTTHDLRNLQQCELQSGELQKLQDDRIEIINDYDEALEIIDKSFVGSGQAHTAGPTNGNPQVQASLGHIGQGHAQASSTHTGQVYAGPTNGNPQDQAGHAQANAAHTGQFYPNNWDPQAQAGHAQASSTHTGPVYGSPTNWNPQAQAGHVGTGHSHANSNHTGPVYASPTNMNLGFQHYHNLQQDAHALQHPAHAQQGVRFPNQVQSNRNWNHSIQNGPTQGQAQQYHAHHAPSYQAAVQYSIAYHARANHHRATSNHGSAYHHQQQQQLSGDHFGNAFGQDIESSLRQNQNVPTQCGPKEFHENPPMAQNIGVKGRKVRTKWTSAQVFKLENKFKSQKYLDPSEREVLARELMQLERRNQVITEVEVKNWFKNRRSKNGKTPKKVQIQTVVIED